MKSFRLLTLILGLLLTGTTLASAEILALINYESKPNQPVRREGIADRKSTRLNSSHG